MASRWKKEIRDKKQLRVYDKGSAWSGEVNTAIASFNKLPFGVTLVKAAAEKKADIVVILAAGAAVYKFSGVVVKTGASFKSDKLHGLTVKFSDEKTKEHLFAVIFLPGKAKTATKKQKEMVIVHEFIHACGMDNDEHDTVGIFCGVMAREDGGLIEYFKMKGAKPMPPIRVGSKTHSAMGKLWPRGGTPKSK